MKRWNILVADEISPQGLDILRACGDAWQHHGLGPDELKKELPGRHALIVRSATKVTAEALEAADELLVIGRAGIGVDNVDLEAATAKGIVVMNTPAAGAVTTAEHAIALMASLARRIPMADRLMHEGKWEKKGLTGVELTGKTLGVIGCGRIGRVVADRALGLHMRVIAHDPFLPPDRMPDDIIPVSLERCLAESDFVTVHVPLSDATHHLIDSHAIAQMKPGARLINCARGGIVDEQALVAALDSGHLAGAALDVYEQEPPNEDHPLLRQTGVVLTPHLGASTEEAKRAVAHDIAEQVVGCLENGIVINGVNVPRVDPSDAEWLAPFLKLATSLASFVVQVFPGKLEKIRVVTQGEIGRRGGEAIRLASVVGAIRSGLGIAVTPVNAIAVADRNDIEVTTSQRIIQREFTDLIRVEVQVDGEWYHTSGTLLGRGGLRILELNGTPIDATPAGEMILTFHNDQPGVIGQMGTLLGAANINISRMQIGLSTNGEAIALLNLDSSPTEEVVELIAGLQPIIRVVHVSLAPGDEREAAPLRVRTRAIE